MFNRFKNDKIILGNQAGILRDNEAFSTAVEEVLNKYAEAEEKWILDDSSKEHREQMRRVQYNAMARRVLLDVVEELNNLVRIGEEADSGLD